MLTRVVLSLLIIISSGLSQCYSQEKSFKWIPFQWQGDTISGKYIEKAYIYVPVKIDELPTDFTMQLDLGTTETQFYGNPIKPYLHEYPSLANKLDSMQHHKDIILEMSISIWVLLNSHSMLCTVLALEKISPWF
ncbi:MAG: hypothetical protein VB022_06840 [Rikenellaceae bacterium]|nr:hypothetical protein [Rikenellaceae bacterium]